MNGINALTPLTGLAKPEERSTNWFNKRADRSLARRQQVNTEGEIWRERKRGELLLEGVSAVLSGHSKEGERVETNEPRKETKETLDAAAPVRVRPLQTERGQVGRHRL